MKKDHLPSQFNLAMDTLAKPDLLHWLRRVAVDWILVIAAMALFHQAFFHWTGLARWSGSFLAILLVGAFQHRLALMGHDGVPHGCILRHRKLNDFLAGLLTFWPIGFPIQGYRRFHLQHHKNVGTQRDPEWAGHKSRPLLAQWKLPLRPVQYVFQVLADLCVIGATPHILRALRLIGPRSFLDALGPAITIGIAVIICWRLGALWIPVVWFAALWSSFWAFFRTRLWIEHAGLELVGHNAEHTYRVEVPIWLRWAICPHNGDCHWEHHFSWDSANGKKCWRVPVWNLRRVRDLVDSNGLGPRVLSLGKFLARLEKEPIR